MMLFKSEKKAVKRLRYWQERLRLNDWDIQLRFNVPPVEAPQEKVDACIWYFTEQAKAVIYLVDPKQLPEAVDQEFLIVHELMHLHTSWFDHSTEGSMSQAHVEIAINRIAEALVRLRREVDGE